LHGPAGSVAKNRRSRSPPSHVGLEASPKTAAGEAQPGIASCGRLTGIAPAWPADFYNALRGPYAEFHAPKSDPARTLRRMRQLRPVTHGRPGNVPDPPCRIYGCSGGLAGAGRAVAGHGDRDRAGDGLPQPARHLRPVRLPAQAAAAGVLVRRRADRRVRRGAAQPDALKDIPKVMTDAVLAIEDARFYEHGGRRLQGHGACGLANLGNAQEPGRLHHHDAGGAQCLPVVRKDLHPQDLRGAADLQAGAPADQGPDPRDLHEPDLPGQPGLRVRGGQRGVFRQAAERHHDRRGRHAGRPAQGAGHQQPDPQPEAGAGAPALHHRPHGGKRLHHRRPGRRRPRRKSSSSRAVRHPAACMPSTWPRRCAS
jgi:hypothetical protein